MEHEFSDKLARLLDRVDQDDRGGQVAEMLITHPELIDCYLQQLRVHSLLEWSLGGRAALGSDEPPFECSLVDAASPTPATTSVAGRRTTARTILWSSVAVIALVVVGILYQPSVQPPVVGQLIAVGDIQWAESTAPLQVGASVRQGVLESTSGSCALRLTSGVELACDDAFRLRIVSGMHVKLERGSLRANVPDGAHGFSVDTPDMVLVDRGTEFGVKTRSGHNTKVVVFRGEVDVLAKDVADGGAPRRLVQGEAVQLVAGSEVLDRVPQVISAGVAHTWSTADDVAALFSIRDNIRASDSLKYYNIVAGGLHEDVPAWVDRLHEWNGTTAAGMPEFIRGADYVKTFNDDRYNPSFKMYVTVHRPAMLYIFVDNRIDKLPDWLVNIFEDTGEDLGLDESYRPPSRVKSARGPGKSIDSTFSIWRRKVSQPAEFEFGSMQSLPSFGMYALAAKPLDWHDSPDPKVEDATENKK
ncbi:MAG: FecR domain-containing protein [Pirellulales bacterium]|nr:FecR domain-containing protein [Pirellulales bacterium]